MIVGYEREEWMRDGEKDGWDESGDVVIKESLTGKYPGGSQEKIWAGRGNSTHTKFNKKQYNP